MKKVFRQRESRLTIPKASGEGKEGSGLGSKEGTTKPARKVRSLEMSSSIVSRGQGLAKSLSKSGLGSGGGGVGRGGKGKQV